MLMAKNHRLAALAALQMGADPEAAGLNAEELETARLEAEQEAARLEAEQEAARLAAEQEAASGGPAQDSEQAETAPGSLKAELLEALKENAKLEAQVENLEAKLSEGDANTASARAVITTCIERLSIALGATIVGLEELSLQKLCAQFNKLDAQFTKTFPVGGRSKPAIGQAETSSTVSDSEFSRRTQAARKITKR